MQATYRSWARAGAPLPRAAWEAIQSLDRYGATQQQAMTFALVLGLFALVAALALPVASLVNPRIGRDRAARSGPWRAGWMDKSP